MSERMDRKKEERRNRILDVAEKIISIKGIDGMTMDDVAREADVATGTVYLYYKNKTSLCAAVGVRLQKQLETVMVERAAIYEMGAERARAAGTATLEFMMENPEKWKAIKQLSLLDPGDTADENVRELLELDNRMTQFLAQCYREAIDEGDIRPDVDPLPTAIFMRQALSISFDPTPRMRALLQMNGVERERWLAVTRYLMTMATHIKKPKEKSIDLRMRAARAPTDLPGKKRRP